MRADELLTLMDAIGVDVTFTVRKTGEVLREHTTGHGRRVHGTVDKVFYDTGAADALSNSFYEDGVSEYKDGEACELYVDKKGRYFMAEPPNRENRVGGSLFICRKHLHAHVEGATS